MRCRLPRPLADLPHRRPWRERCRWLGDALAGSEASAQSDQGIRDWRRHVTETRSLWTRAAPWRRPGANPAGRASGSVAPVLLCQAGVRDGGTGRMNLKSVMRAELSLLLPTYERNPVM